ncbi:hypothetical protein [Cryobacterium sp. N19]|uniref:hypothetical protein n=1 Tax=Cryobacterium sp. N19 TaxID=2048288 RepID=UPI000CE4494E|nr:hypothetical protein [Cryobacterium sp. N19]
MDIVRAMLIGVGGLLVLVNLVSGIFELCTLGTIRPPKQKTFTQLRLAENQYQNIVGPAIGALISGLFVSISASFIYDGITIQGDSWRQVAGPVTFICGVVALMITLRAFLNGVGEPAELARDPFTIRAAAEEYSADPRRGPLDPSFLQHRMNEWTQYISTRALNIAADKNSPNLDRVLLEAAKQRKFWRSVAASLHVYFAAFVRFPLRFAWPLLGFVLLPVGAVWSVVSETELDFTRWSSFAAVAAMLVVSVVPSATVTLFYCATRGNRARLWHRTLLVGVNDAHKAIDDALSAHTAIATEDAVLQRFLERAHIFLQADQSARAKSNVTFSLGMFDIAITSKTQKRPKKASHP